MRVMTFFLAAGLTVAVSFRTVANEPTLDGPSFVKKLDVTKSTEAHQAAEQFLRHLYAVYFAVRGCTEAGLQLAKPEYLSSGGVTLEDARRTMKVVDAVAKEAGLNVDRIWADVAPLGLITAEALKKEPPDHTKECRAIGGVFRVDLGNLQNALTSLGSRRTLIEKDF
jgi:hypothetical protein